MGKKIYLVEDEVNLGLLLEKYLTVEGYEVKIFNNGTDALMHVNSSPDLWVLDVMLPDIDGYSLIKEIKKINEDAKVLFMSARNKELDRVLGLELGGEDYISKPFLPRELVIRVNRILNRSEKNTSIITLKDYTIKKLQRTVYKDSEEIQLTNKEYEMLLYFAENINMVLSREQILNKVWGDDYFGSDRVVDDTMRRVRKKLDGLNISTVYGYGYKLILGN
ncbi:response regulator transcription factor [uncultured Clostridium sp.]|uniref:response regulator transcription factor n=1 Tax=uncultured Clostridium sp. TaxID=59620 RepID=UPI002629B0D1|nr:response regulator transcription factor [uncultured Clostridium sp.]